MKHLLFTLEGPMASWGGPAPGTQRPTDGHPTKSAVIGLIAASMGVKHDEEERYVRLAESLGYAVRTDRPGNLLRDYHTAQVPQREKKIRYPTRRHEIHRDPQGLQTILSNRDYLCDAHWTTCVWARPDAVDGLLEDAKVHLERPIFTPYLGRKSCPPAMPFWPRILEAKTLRQAFGEYAIPFTGRLTDQDPAAVHWEPVHPDPGFLTQDAVLRRDAVLDHSRRTFRTRWDHVTRKEIPRCKVEAI